jgi:hypothetical protein
MHNTDEVENTKKDFNEEELDTLAKKFTDSLGGLLLSFIIIFLSPYVVSLMWKWFVVSLGAPKIGYWHAFGIVLLVDFLTYKVTNTKDVTNKQILQVLGYILFTWLIAFGISFLV